MIISLPVDFVLSSASRLEGGGEKGLTPSCSPAVPLSVVQTMALHPQDDSWSQCLTLAPWCPLEATTVCRPSTLLRDLTPRPRESCS